MFTRNKEIDRFFSRVVVFFFDGAGDERFTRVRITEPDDILFLVGEDDDAWDCNMEL